MNALRIFNCRNFTEFSRQISYIDKSTEEMVKVHLDLFFNAKLIEADYYTSDNDKINILALDNFNTPVILLFQNMEYGNIISNGAYCIDWLLSHKLEFNNMAVKTIPDIDINNINWNNARILCIGGDFSKHDKYLVSQLNRNIELIKCRRYGNDLIAFETAYKTDKQWEFVKNDIPSPSPTSVETTEQDKPKRYTKVYQSPRIGYCMIEGNIHYIVFPNKEKQKIFDIPTSIYIAQNQFILVDEYNCFRYAFPYWVGDNEIITSNINSFAVVSMKDNDIYIEKGDNVFQRLNNIPSTVQLREKNIVSVDSQNSFIRFYKPIKHNADSFMQSAKAKGHQLTFVLKILPDGVLLRDIETGKEFFKAMSADGATFKEQQILCLHEGNIVHSLNSCKFYTLSSFYDKFEYGIIEIKDGLTFLKKLSGETVIINDAPLYLKAGQVAYVDENNNFCGIEDNGEVPESDTVKRNVTNIHTFKRISKKDKIEVTKSVLILGNNTYANSYKLCLLKFGYKAEVIEGFEPWTKINTEIKETDIVVVITSHISHDNMWRVKKEITDIPVIYSEFDGANRILEQVLAVG